MRVRLITKTSGNKISDLREKRTWRVPVFCELVDLADAGITIQLDMMLSRSFFASMKKSSMRTYRELDCHAASLLAMTAANVVKFDRPV
ncbi:hypothetical protein BIU88_08965 [Chlorobaculum limnaeum]|uniref:Uncharacterized protein n=1 Tax=Chlorobaculum limnaeum TaxID=274537 RepID=A0A1D8D908_CHLLM|nr:hypothetical protein BIU88_08965 [Chlorobaculum limnaeum]